MKLDDNTRAGLHYLALGTVVVLFFMAAFQLLLRVQAASLEVVPVELRPLRAGYLLDDPTAIPFTHDTLAERIVIAIALSLCGGLVAAFLTALLVRAMGRSARRWFRVAVLVITIPLFGWFAFAACRVPSQVMLPDAEPDGIVFHIKPSILGLPFPLIGGKLYRIPRSHINGFAHRERPLTGGAAVEHALVYFDGDEEMISSTRTAGSTDDAASVTVRGQMEQAAKYLQARYLNDHP